MGLSFPIVFKDLEALQLYKSCNFSNDHFYIICVKLELAEVKYEYKRIIYNHTFPSRIIRTDIILETSIIKKLETLGNELVEIIDDYFVIFQCEFLISEDKKNRYWITGCQNSIISYKDQTNMHNKLIEPEANSFENNLKFKVPSLNSSMIDLSCVSTPQLTQKHSRNASNIIHNRSLLCVLDYNENLIMHKPHRQVSYANIIDKVPLTDFSAIIESRSRHSQSPTPAKLPKFIRRLKILPKIQSKTQNLKILDYISEKNKDYGDQRIKFRYIPKPITLENKVVEAINRVFKSKSWV